MRTPRLWCLILALLLTLQVFSGYVYAAPVEKAMTVEAARKLAVAKDNKIKLKLNEVTLKKIKRDESIAKGKAKAKNLQTFRWTPLLSFKFPEKLDLTMDYTLKADPDVIKAEIDKLQHEADDLIYAVLDKTTKLFVELYLEQENIAFTQNILSALQKDLKKNKARLITGEAKQSDVDLIETAITGSEKELASLRGDFESNKIKLRDLIGIDVTTGYKFYSPLKTFLPDREQLENIVIKGALDKDHQLYNAKEAVSVAKINLNAYKQLYRSHYGAKMDMINKYITAAEAGMDIDGAAFTLDYKDFLTKIDAPWQGSWVIINFWFIKISVPKEWIKGSMDGIRYVQEEPYALYTACMELAQAIKEKNQTEKELIDNINAQYKSLVSARNSVNGLSDTTEKFRKELDKLIELNKQGKADFGEVNDKRNDYLGVQKDLSAALGDYNILLSAFDRLCCGVVWKLMTESGTDFGTGGGGTSYIDKPSYSIYTDVDEMLFVFTVHMPIDYEPAATHFEIWYEEVMIGEQTPVEKPLRHLKLDYGESNTLTVKLYNEGAYLGECVIDTTISSDILEYGALPVAEDAKTVAYYDIETTVLGDELSTTKLTISPIDKDIAFYRVKFLGNTLLSEEYVPAKEAFIYLTLLSGSLVESTVELYDMDKNVLYSAVFDEAEQTLKEVK